MTQSQLLCVEIRTVSQNEIELQDFPLMTIFVDSNSNYNFATGVEEIKTAIASMIPHLGTNCRYPLMFRVQLVSGSDLDASLFSLAHYNTPSRKRRRRRGTC